MGSLREVGCSSSGLGIPGPGPPVGGLQWQGQGPGPWDELGLTPAKPGPTAGLEC